MLETVATGSTPPQRSLIANHRGLLASAALLAGAMILSRVVAFGKDWLVARRFGASDELDAFLVAFLLPTYVIAVLAQSFSSAFTPGYLRVREQQGAAASRQLLGDVLTRGSITLLAAALVLIGLSPYVLPWLGTGFSEAKLALAQSLLFLLSGVVVAAGLSAMFAAVLNANEHFKVTAAAQFAMPVVTAIIFWSFEQTGGIYALAAGTLLGFIAEAILLAAAMRHYGLLPRPRWGRADENLRRVATQFWPLLLGALVMSSSPMVDQSMAASLGSGNVSILNYGNKIVALLLSMVAVSLSTVLFPLSSRLIAAGQLETLQRTVRTYAALILIGSVPAMTLLAWFGEPLVRLLFERGAFTAETTRAVSAVQLCYVPQIPFFILGMLGARLLSALDANRIVLRISILNLALNVAGNYVFMRWFGVAGIALSTSLVYLVSTLAIFLAIRGTLAERDGAREATETDPSPDRPSR